MMTTTAEPFVEEPTGGPAVRGFLHRPASPARDAIILTHGAGSNSQSRLLLAVSEALANAGFLVLRCDLPFRQARRTGPPFPATAALDRAGLRNAAAAMRKLAPGRVFLGGHSYGGRQATLLAADEPDLTAALLLLSYPLHPPTKPQNLRTAHFSKLRTPALFLHGSRDPFGSAVEMRAALSLIPARTELVVLEGAGHDLRLADVAERAVAAIQRFIFIG